MLSVCGGYQLLGHEYRPHATDVLPGIGFFDAVSTAGPERFIGNVVVESQWGELVGFENHSGLTMLNRRAAPMGKVRLAAATTARTAARAPSATAPSAATCTARCCRRTPRWPTG